MTDRADTIRGLISALKEGWPDESTVAGNCTRREIVAALEDAVAERQQAIDQVAKLRRQLVTDVALLDNESQLRQQAIDERDGWKESAMSELREKEKLRARCEQAIDALRVAAERLDALADEGLYAVDSVREVIRAALGEQP